MRAQHTRNGPISGERHRSSLGREPSSKERDSTGLFTGLTEAVISSVLCNYFKKYSGPQCANLKTAIVNNVDIYQLWVDNASREGVWDLKEARRWTNMFPEVQHMVTSQSVKRWLKEQGLKDVVVVVESTQGGEEWLVWQVNRFRAGLWGGQFQATNRGPILNQALI